MKLNARQQAMLEHIMRAGPEQVFASSDFASTAPASTVSRDLVDLVKQGLLVPEGATKGRRYRVDRRSRPFLEWDLSRPPEERPVVQYNPSFLESYSPGETNLLSAEQNTRLWAVASNGGATAGSIEPQIYARVLARMLIDLAHASSNLENVNISWLETKNLIEFAEASPSLSAVDRTIVLNHKNAIKFMVEHADLMTISPRDVRDLHALLADGLIADPKAVGALRHSIVHFSDSRYLPLQVPDVLREDFDRFCSKATAIADPFEQAFFVMVMMPYLQPFQDVNKRTSRLTMNLPLIQRRLPPFSFAKIRRTDYMLGLLAVYERNDVSILADAFVAAYVASTPTYRDLVSHVQAGGILGTVIAPPLQILTEEAEESSEGANRPS